MFRVDIKMYGPQACGKTVLAKKLEEFLLCEAPAGTRVTIVEYTGDTAVVDLRYRRETKFDV